jgi:hypothetical protein
MSVAFDLIDHEPPDVLVVPSRRVRQPEAELMRAVLETAIADRLARGQAAAITRNGKRIRPIDDATRWFLGRDRRWPYSFENVCAVLGLDPGSIRRRLGMA